MPMMHSVTAPTPPVYKWPEQREPHEGDHPGHGEGSDESSMFVGINSNVSNTAVTLDSSASGIGPYTSVGWLPRGLNLFTSLDQFPVGDLNVSTNATKHLNNPWTIQTRRSSLRRR
jgi:hypothetical protein